MPFEDNTEILIYLNGYYGLNSTQSAFKEEKTNDPALDPSKAQMPKK